MFADTPPLAGPDPSLMAPQFFLYAGAGAIGTAAHYGVLIGLVQLAGAGPVAASTAGAFIGALINYALNHCYTFASRRAHRAALPRFLAVAGASMLLNAAVIALLLNTVQLHYIVVQIVATGVVLMAGFFVNRRWTFGTRGPRGSAR